jgi:hypothetical protein
VRSNNICDLSPRLDLHGDRVSLFLRTDLFRIARASHRIGPQPRTRGRAGISTVEPNLHRVTVIEPSAKPTRAVSRTYAFPEIGVPAYSPIAPSIDRCMVYSVVRTESAFDQRETMEGDLSVPIGTPTQMRAALLH